MSETEVIIRLTLVALLSAYLLRRHERRVQQQALVRWFESEPADWDGTAFDAEAFRRARAELPVDFIESARARGGPGIWHEERIDAARSRILGLGWFRHRLPEEVAEAKAA